MSQRIAKLQAQLAPHQAVLLSQATDVTYFTRFQILVPEEREALVLVTPESAFLFHGRFCPVTNEPGITNVVASYPGQVADQIAHVRQNTPFSTLAIDKSSLFVDEYEALTRNSEVSLTELDRNWVWAIRALKDKTEIAAITQASQIAHQSWLATRKKITLGLSEEAVRDMLESELKERGSQRPAFPTIVAFGDHTALPHHQPTNRKLTTNTPILIDFGATVDGYRSDMTRTWWYGEEPAPEFTKVEGVIHDAYDDALATLAPDRPRPTAKDIDTAARQRIIQAGYGEYFIHTTGHGVGLDIHEQPSLNFRNHTPIEPAMVITIEPGIYLDGQFGYRYENTVLITKSGASELTK